MRDFFGRDLLPLVNMTIFIAIDSPTGASGSQPTRLVGSPIEIAINISIDLDSVLVIAPLIHLIVPIFIEKPPQQASFGMTDVPADNLLSRFGLDRAFSALLFAWLLNVYGALDRSQLQCRLDGWLSGRQVRGCEQTAK